MNIYQTCEFCGYRVKLESFSGTAALMLRMHQRSCERNKKQTDEKRIAPNGQPIIIRRAAN